MIDIKYNNDTIDVYRDNKIVRISKKHEIYAHDIVNHFDEYFLSTVSEDSEDCLLVDFSQPKEHQVVGYDRHAIHFPAFVEGYITVKQYLEFANIREGDTVLDLGAHAGMASIVFKDVVGDTGNVIAVEPDEINLISLEKNIQVYKNSTGRTINLERSAIWNHCSGIGFSCEGNLGSAAQAFVGARGDVKFVGSITLSAIVEKFKLDRIDFIKCDVEGTEKVLFQDDEFFTRFKPRIVIEDHWARSQFIPHLEKYGYTFNIVSQKNSKFDLVECTPG
jgi:FkbM family methyltransferase